MAAAIAAAAIRVSTQLVRFTSAGFIGPIESVKYFLKLLFDDLQTLTASVSQTICIKNPHLTPAVTN